MKKYLSVLLMAFVLIGLTGCSASNDDTTSSAIEKIKASGKLVLLTEATFPPFEYQDSSEGSVDGVNGVDIEFGKALAEKLGVELEVLNLDFGTLVESLKSGKGDLIAAGMTNTPDRATQVDFSSTYFDNSLYIVKKAGTSFETTADLAGTKIAVQLGTTGNEVALEIEGAEVMEFKGMVEAGLAVSTGKADVSIMDYLTASLIVKNQAGLELNKTPLTAEETAIAVPKGSDLLDLVNETLTELKSSGQLDTWFNTHFDAVVIE